MKKALITFIIMHCALCIMHCQNIYKFAIDDEINSKTWIYTQEALKEANTLNPNLIILHLNTYGGEVVYADSIRTAILRTETPIVAYIDNNAASAGALISIACDRIYMRSGSQIGAATVVNGVDGSKMPDKYQSYMRATMRATAESHGKDSLGRWRRDPIIAEAMVDESVYIEGVIDTGKILTFTTKEAIEHHYCEAEVDNLDQLLIAEGYTPEQCTITEYKPSLYDKLKGTLMGTALRSILIMLIINVVLSTAFICFIAASCPTVCRCFCNDNRLMRHRFMIIIPCSLTIIKSHNIQFFCHRYVLLCSIKALYTIPTYNS